MKMKELNFFKKEKKLSTVVTLSKEGDKYVGKSTSDGKRHGKGELHFYNGNKYFGDWKNDKKDGFGIFITELSIYYGLWSLDEKEGMGIEIFKDGSYFDGFWKKGIKSGEGLMKLSNGILYFVFISTKGDTIYGIWNHEQVQGIFKKGSIQSSSKLDFLSKPSSCSINLLKEKVNSMNEFDLSFGVVKPSKLINKWESLFLSYQEMITDLKEKFKTHIYKEIESFILSKKDIGKQNIHIFVENLCK
jgi:hypothetical protein